MFQQEKNPEKMTSKTSQSSIDRSLSKLTFIHQVVGLQCFSVNARSLKLTSGVSGRHKLFLLINLIFAMVEMCAPLPNSFSKLRNGGLSGVKTGLIVQLVAWILIHLVIFVSLVGNILLRTRAKTFFKNCYQIFEILALLNQVVDYSALESKFKLTLSKLFFGFILSNVVVTVFVYHFDQRILTIAWFVIYPYFFFTSLVSYCTLLVRLIGENLRHINECLLHLHKKHKLSCTYPKPYNQDSKVSSTQETINFIAKLKRIYAIIYDLTSLVNELISLPICAFMVFVVFANISGGYKIYLVTRGDVSVAFIAVPLCTMYTTSILIGTLISSCSSTCNIVDDILTLLHKFDFKVFEREAGIPSIFSEFAFQILQRPIEFKVRGFYCLNQQLLAKVFTGIFTYIILLVQFYTPES